MPSVVLHAIRTNFSAPILGRLHSCTVPQVLEETGLDISGGLRESDFIDVQLGDQDTRLFIVQVWEAGRAGLVITGMHCWQGWVGGSGRREKGGAAAACIAGLGAEGAGQLSGCILKLRGAGLVGQVSLQRGGPLPAATCTVP